MCTVGVTKPQIIVVNNSAVVIRWFKPTYPNGLISTYRLYRSRSGVESFVLVYSGPSYDLSTLDADVQPGTQYRYLLEAENDGGATNSSCCAKVTLPEATPASVPAIQNLTALSTSIYVEWDDPPNSTIDRYRVVLIGESVEHRETSSNSINITGLRPFTWYSVRLAACLQGIPNSCGTSHVSRRIQTLEAPPEDQLPPILTSTGPTTVIVSWQPPVSPNGVILLYRIRRHEWVPSGSSASESGVLINVVNGSVHSFTNNGVDLRPFTVYEYSITAVNSEDEATSNWTEVRTLEAAPQGMSQPVVSTVGRYIFFMLWQPPSKPNGLIDKYELEYGVVNADHSIGGLSTLGVSGTTHNTSVSGVEPYTNHAVRIRAVNVAGSAVSAWTNFTTLPASPSGLSVMSVELVPGGRSAILSWSPPTQPNGRILNYAVYTDARSNAPVYLGVNLQFELLDLEPYTKYSVQLQACTFVGCTRSPWQQFTTFQAPPANQQTPSVDYFNSTSVLIAWSRPEKTFGDILTYELLRRTLPIDSGMTKRSVMQYEIIYTTTDTGQTRFTYLDTAVLPFTR